jgi:hypothetical protein
MVSDSWQILTSTGRHIGRLEMRHWASVFPGLSPVNGKLTQEVAPRAERRFPNRLMVPELVIHVRFWCEAGLSPEVLGRLRAPAPTPRTCACPRSQTTSLWNCCERGYPLWSGETTRDGKAPVASLKPSRVRKCYLWRVYGEYPVCIRCVAGVYPMWIAESPVFAGLS